MSRSRFKDWVRLERIESADGWAMYVIREDEGEKMKKDLAESGALEEVAEDSAYLKFLRICNQLIPIPFKGVEYMDSFDQVCLIVCAFSCLPLAIPVLLVTRTVKFIFSIASALRIPPTV